MTAYNREKFIAEAIDSVLASTFEDFELIIVDDCSTDQTPEIAKRFAAQDNRVRFFRNEENLGDYPNRNCAASYAGGKYLKYLDSDDVIYPHGLGVMVRCMEMYPGAGFGLSATAERGVPHPRLLSPEQSYKRHFETQDLFGRAPGSSIILREAFEQFGGFSGQRQIGDYEFWFGLARNVDLVTMPRDLYWARTHDDQEKAKDSELDKAAMRYNVVLAALDHENCPLSKLDRVKARRNQKSKAAKLFWRNALIGEGIESAFTFRRKLGLEWPETFRILDTRSD